jgi:hypothetical protein
VSLRVKGNLITCGLPAESTITVKKGDQDPDDYPPSQQVDPLDNHNPDTPQSGDPNEIRGSVGLGDVDTERYVLPGEWLEYVIYFENKSTATAAAQEVWVENPLSQYFDLSTFELGEVVFNNQTETGLQGKSSGEIEVAEKNGTNHVRINVTLDKAGGTAKWYLRSVDPASADGWPADAYAGFLPPNDETHRGEGHLSYRVKILDSVPTGTRIDNAATIVFDYNEAIATDPAWFNNVITQVPMAPVYVGPANGAGSVSTAPVLTWNKSDYATTYSVWLWKDGGAKPEVATASDLKSPFYEVPVDLLEKTGYHWQVAAGNPYGFAAGAEWTFTTLDTILHNLFVIGGSGSGLYHEGQSVTISADAKPEGYAFVVWTATSGTLENPAASTTVLTMPASDLTVHAYFSASFAAWASGLPADRQGPEDDAAGDGIANIVKYACGLDPSVPCSWSSVFTQSMDLTGGLEITFRKSKLATDVTIVPEWSADLADWSSDGVTLEKVSEDVISETWRASVTNGNVKFLRLAFR